LKPHPFLISIVEAQSSVREEMYFMKEQKLTKEEKEAKEADVVEDVEEQ
jgi:hypothetical protein